MSSKHGGTEGHTHGQHTSPLSPSSKWALVARSQYLLLLEKRTRQKAHLRHAQGLPGCHLPDSHCRAPAPPPSLPMGEGKRESPRQSFTSAVIREKQERVSGLPPILSASQLSIGPTPECADLIALLKGPSSFWKLPLAKNSGHSNRWEWRGRHSLAFSHSCPCSCYPPSLGAIPGPGGQNEVVWGHRLEEVFGDSQACAATGACLKASSSSLGVNFPSCSLFLHLGVLVTCDKEGR